MSGHSLFLCNILLTGGIPKATITEIVLHFNFDEMYLKPDGRYGSKPRLWSFIYREDMENIYKALMNNKDSNFYPFHMPGHKRNIEMIKKHGLWDETLTPYDIDITEIDNFDNLHNPEGIIKKAQKRAARLYGARESIYSVNGSTGAILATLGILNRGDSVLIARNCHKAVYHGAELYGLVPHYIEGEVDGLGIYQSIKPKEIENILKANKKKCEIIDKEDEQKQQTNVFIKLVVITSPTYEGVVSDIREIADICHKYSALLMVDEAHGAHFGFDEYFPETAVRQGADFVVQSLHKTLPSFTQTAILHICNEDETIINRIRRQFNLIETSSPSYVFMAGMENCLSLIDKEGRELFAEYKKRLVDFRSKAAELKNIKVYLPDNCCAYDYGKIVITAGINSGVRLYKCLYEEYHLIMEMKSKDYVIAMTSIFDTDEGFERLIKALFKIDNDKTFFKLDNNTEFDYTLRSGNLPKRKLIPSEALELSFENREKVPLEASEGLIAAEYVYFYPPGIPLLVPGEVIEESVIHQIKAAKQNGIEIYGGCDGNGIFVCTHR